MPISPGCGIFTGVTTPMLPGDGTATGVNFFSSAFTGSMRVGTTRGFAGARGAGGSCGISIHGAGEPPTSPGAGQPVGAHPAFDFVGRDMVQATPAPRIISPATNALTFTVQPSMACML
jgi:hypothetical protein